MIQKDNFYQNREVVEILISTFQFIKKNFRDLTINSLYVAGPAILISYVCNIKMSYIDSLNHNSSGLESIVLFDTSNFYGRWSFWLALVGAILLSIVVYEYIALKATSENKKIKTKDVIRIIINDWWILTKTFVGLTTTYIAIIISVVLFSLIFGGMSNILQNSVENPVTKFLVPLLILAFIITLLYFISPLSLLFNIRVIEKSSYFKSLIRAYSLTKNQKWNTLAIFVIAIIIQISGVFVFHILNFLLEKFQLPAETFSPNPVGKIIRNTILLLFMFFTFIASTVVISHQYFNLVKRSTIK